MMETTMTIGNNFTLSTSNKNLGRKCFAFTRLDASEIRRIPKTVFGVGAKVMKA